MYKDQLDRLVAERVFVQYKPTPDKRNAEHEKALDDFGRSSVNMAEKAHGCGTPILPPVTYGKPCSTALTRDLICEHSRGLGRRTGKNG